MKINKLIGVMLIFSCIIMLNGCKKNQYKAYSITYFDYFINIHTGMPADFCQLVGKCYIDGAESIFRYLCHFGRAYIGNYDFSCADEYNSFIFIPTLGLSAPIVRLL